MTTPMNYTLVQLVLSCLGCLFIGWLGHWTWMRLALSLEIARREKIEAEAARILAGFRRYTLRVGQRFGLTTKVRDPNYQPRHAAEANEEAPKADPLPKRIPGATLQLEPVPELPVAEVFAE